MNRAITVIWSSMLVATLLGIVPVVVRLLTRALTAANNIERYTRDILASGVGIAGNTANVAALKDTIAIAPRLLTGAASIEQHASTISEALGQPANTAGEVRP